MINLSNHTYELTQLENIKKLKQLNMNNATTAYIIAERAHGAYIVAICRPDATYILNIASQITNPEKEDIKNLNKIINLMQDSAEKGVKFVPLDVDSTSKDVFVDASFSANPDSSAQLRFIITLMEKFENANIVYYGILKSKRVTRNVLASECFALVHGFDISSIILLTLNAMVDRVVSLHIYTDSRILYDRLTRINQTM